jgi:argininosuccinate synthase
VPQTICDFASLDAIADERRSIVVLYSGGLDGTYLLHRLAQRPDTRVHALTIDLGGNGDLTRMGAVCERTGAEHVVVDRRRDLLEDFVAPAIVCQARYLGSHPISASLTRPLMAQAAVEVAKERGATVIVHTATSGQNSLRRFHGALSSLGFDGRHGSPYAVPGLSRAERAQALEAAGLPGPRRPQVSTDVNLWAREFEAGPLDDPETVTVLEDLFEWTQRTSGDPAEIEVGFELGRPVRLDQEAADLDVIVDRLNSLVGSFGIGRYVELEELPSGLKVQEVREMPAATLLFDAYRRVEQATVPAESIRCKQVQEQLWVREAVEGRWFGDLRRASQAFASTLAQRVTGTVRYRLQPGGFTVTSLVADAPLYLRSRPD